MEYTRVLSCSSRLCLRMQRSHFERASSSLLEVFAQNCSQRKAAVCPLLCCFLICGAKILSMCFTQRFNVAVCVGGQKSAMPGACQPGYPRTGDHWPGSSPLVVTLGCAYLLQV